MTNNYSEVSKDEYEVYSAFFHGENAIEQKSGNKSKKQYVECMTVDIPLRRYSADLDINDHGDGIVFDSVLVDEFKAKNEKAYKLENRIIAPQGIAILSKQEMKEFFSGNWDDFYRKYPDAEGVTAFSRVGFNANKTKAVFYNEFLSNGEAGDAWLYFAQKNSYGWVCRPISQAWIA